MNNPLLRFFAALGALLILAATGWGVLRWRDTVSDIQTTDNAYVHGEITVLSPRIAGYVVEITADDDQPVAPKQVLVRIDPRDYRATYDRAHALVSQAETQVTEARSRLLAQEAKVAVAAASLDTALGQSRNADIILSRARQLLGTPAGNPSVFDNAQAADISARAAVTQAQANLGFESQQLAVAGADIAVAESSVATARATAYSARIALEDTQVWAPLAGTVAARRTRVGEYVTAGTRLLPIVPRTGLWIEANMRETQIGAMAPLDPVRIRVDTFPGKAVCGYVEAIAPAAASEFAPCRRTTPPATSPRSCAASPCVSGRTRQTPTRPCCAPACRPRSPWPPPGPGRVSPARSIRRAT